MNPVGLINLKRYPEAGLIQAANDEADPKVRWGTSTIVYVIEGEDIVVSHVYPLYGRQHSTVECWCEPELDDEGVWRHFDSPFLTQV